MIFLFLWSFLTAVEVRAFKSSGELDLSSSINSFHLKLAVCSRGMCLNLDVVVDWQCMEHSWLMDSKKEVNIASFTISITKTTVTVDGHAHPAESKQLCLQVHQGL